MTTRTARLSGGTLALILALVALGCGTASPAAPQPTAASDAQPLTISVAQADDALKHGSFILDVREPAEWAAGHIAGATLIPLGQLSSRLAEVPRDRLIVVVCHTGNRSAQGRDILRAAGFAITSSMAGGMTAWLAAGRPVVTGP